jgi:hypothetical protein
MASQSCCLYVGDETVPSTVGYTIGDRNEEKGDSYVWVLKKEHFELDEVSGILKNQLGQNGGRQGF